MSREAENTAVKSLFISRAGADADFAAIIGSMLKAAGYAVTLQQWDFANRNFIERMHAVLAAGARVVALLSPEYLSSDHCQAEWQNAIADDPLNTKERLILLRVAECEPIGLLRGLAFWDLVPVRDNPALVEEIVRAAVIQDRRAAAPTGPYWRAPRTFIDGEAIRPIPSFSGRADEILAINEALLNDGSVAVYGLGGVGKSSIAREYAWRKRDEYALIWWLNAQTENGIIDGFLRLGSLFVRGLDQIPDRRTAAQQVTGSILNSFSKPVLLIFDNLEDERLLRTWQPRTGSRALVTSRNAEWSADIVAIALDTWSLDVAVSYLRRESARPDLTESDARAIAEALGALPLALSHAAATLRQMRMVTPMRYLEHLAEHLANAPHHAEYPHSVFATFQTAIAAAEQQAPGAAALICLAARFAPDAVPDELFRQSLDVYAGTLRPLLPDGHRALDLHAALNGPHLDKALSALDQLSLLSFTVTSNAYAVHRLVQLAGRDLVSNAKLAWAECAVTAVEAVFPEVEFGEIAFTAWPRCERLISHACATLDAMPGDIEFIPAARLADRCAVYLTERGDYEDAEPMQKFALTTLERAYGPDHLDVAASLNHLASLRWEQGFYEEAEPLHARALSIREKALGPDHPTVAVSLNDLAIVYNKEGRYADAEALHWRSLAIREKVHGAEHLNVAVSLNNLAITYENEGRYGEAESLHKRALATKERLLGPDHPNVARSLDNLGGNYYEQKRHAEAEPLLTRALAIREEALGPAHPDVAYTLNNLAAVYREQGRYGEAASLLMRALTIRERALGPDHPYIAWSLSGLALVYRRQGRYGEAEALLMRGLAIREKALGRHHPEVAYSLAPLALVYQDQRRYEDAESLLMRALAIREGALDPEHVDIATSLIDLATLCRAQHRFAKAAALYTRALAIREKALGQNHPLTKAAHEELATIRSRS